MTNRGLPKEYNVWRGMIDRCYREKNASYDRYGGRGITVCLRWRNDFMAFYADIGARPTDKHSIERVDNEIGYTPDNCKWALPKVQARNRGSNVNITANGETKCLEDWATDTGLSASTIRRRLKRMSQEDAVSTPSLVTIGAKIKAHGKALTIDGWAKELGLDKSTIWRRLKNLTPEEALKTRSKKDADNGIAKKAVRQLTKEGVFIAEFFSISEAGRQTGVDFRLISAVLNGKQNTTGGFRWEFK